MIIEEETGWCVLTGTQPVPLDNLFTKNLQGDILNIYDTSGNCVASYTYNAWGEQTVTNYTSANIGNINPFRYRGYYYDTETGFYYLNARYYDPQIKRFVNADTYINANGDFDGFNMYAYCSNNPIILRDKVSWRKFKQFNTIYKRKSKSCGY